MVSFYSFPPGIYGLDNGNQWEYKNYNDPSALVFSFNGTTVPRYTSYSNLGNEINSCFFDPTSYGDRRFGTLLTNLSIDNTLGYFHNPWF